VTETSSTQRGSKQRSRLYIVALLAFATLGVWQLWTQVLYPTYPARYELTIEVETPNGIKTGSSVIEARYGWEPTFYGLIPGVRNSLRGEAVYVDLGDGKNLFVTLVDKQFDRAESLSPLRLPSKIFEFPTHNKFKTRQGISDAKKKGKREIPLRLLPLVVTFEDLNDPKSVRLVDVFDISTIFGEGYILLRAEIEMTSKPLPNKLPNALLWLERYYDKKLDDQEIEILKETQNLANHLASGSFKIE
jgi:hypothetical protein